MPTNLKRTGILFLAGVFLASAFTTIIPRQSQADTLNSAIVALFPKDAGEFAYADLKSARKFPWFAQLHDQVLPVYLREFERFLSTAGVDPNAQVEELAWAFIPANDAAPEEMLGVALGQFNPSATEQAFMQRKLPIITDRGFHLYASGGTGAGDILFVFIDSNTAAFGRRAALDRMLDVRAGLVDNITHNETLGPLITEANGSGLFWAVMNRAYTQLTLRQLLPQEASQFPQAAKVVDRLQSMFLNIHADSGVDTHFHAVCASPDDANVLAAALQAGILYRKYQATQTNPDLASALDEVKITAAGDRLTIEAPVSEDQITALLRKGTFAVKM